MAPFLLVATAMNRYLLPLAAFITFACGPDSVTYDASHDDAAIAAVTRVWQGDGMTLSLCEDLAAEATTDDGPGSCEQDHVVRGGSRTVTKHEDRHGCAGGCSKQNIALLSGQLSQTGSDLDVTARVVLGSSYDADPYAFPYDFNIRKRSDDSFVMEGSLEADGTLTLTIDSTKVTLAPVQATACP
jgi:hypothetical protein